MNLTLREEDRRAVDLLLDRGAQAVGNGNGGGHGKPVYASADPSLGERAARVQQLLQLLESLPDVEPSADLAARTIRTAEESARTGTIRTLVPNLLGGQRPVA